MKYMYGVTITVVDWYSMGEVRAHKIPHRASITVVGLPVMGEVEAHKLNSRSSFTVHGGYSYGRDRGS